jgi:hypothetical protein
VDFVFVVIQDVGHPVSGMEFFADRSGGPEQRRAHIARALGITGLTLPTVVDTEDAATQQAYSAWPQRLFVVSAEGRIALDAGRGMPRGWDFEQVRACLDREMTPGAHGQPLAEATQNGGNRHW